MDLKLQYELLEYNEDVGLSIKKQYNIDKQEQMDQIIKLLEEWIHKQPHFGKKNFSQKYLENAILSAKGSVERAKGDIERLCTLKTLYPVFFQEYDLKNILSNLKGYFIQCPLPKLTDKNCRVIMSRIVKDGMKSHMFFNVYQSGVMFMEYIKMYDCNDGVIVVTDLRNISLMDIISELNMTELRQILTISMEGYALRMKGVHFITSSSTIEILTKLFKSVVSAKIGSRVYAHKSLETLYEFVPKDILPVEYGGDEVSLQGLDDKWTDVLTTPENIKFFKDVIEFRTDETLRPKALDEPYMGIAGSFRTLTVD
ncbi:hypothetical protein K1T71_011332 [Dendrolimus kikuchii]|uniref:Uncharacterized protein n=1 Tax=Dendrolimus kikuchii TaxID=765133 RepID=A0ACC1CNP6_9NEOP|nr:hypothetical protein K1T71_011332 [Dendrolimus kikuchii]